MQNNERIIELIAKAIDEPLTAQEQAQVDLAMQNSLALRVAADGLREFDALLKRTSMVIPDEGFPLRVLMRLETYESKRSRAQWLLTLAVFFLGSLAALVWLAFNGALLVNAVIQLLLTVFFLIPFAFTLLFAVIGFIGQGPMLIYALLVLSLTLVWARASGSWNPSRIGK